MAPTPTAVLGSAVLHVADVEESLRFYEAAFGLQRRFLDERRVYAELDTGPTVLALTQRDFAREQAGDTRVIEVEDPPPPSELAFTVADVAAGVTAAVEAGAALLREPATKYWGQVVAYVRDPDGHLLQISTAVDP